VQIIRNGDISIDITNAFSQKKAYPSFVDFL
jgi:hypothetical protein